MQRCDVHLYFFCSQRINIDHSFEGEHKSHFRRKSSKISGPSPC
jgi:hypothetical protein